MKCAYCGKKINNYKFFLPTSKAYHIKCHKQKEREETDLRKSIELVESEIEEQKNPNSLCQLYALLHKLKERVF